MFVGKYSSTMMKGNTIVCEAASLAIRQDSPRHSLALHQPLNFVLLNNGSCECFH